jgi:hypothetical protein
MSELRRPSRAPLEYASWIEFLIAGYLCAGKLAFDQTFHRDANFPFNTVLAYVRSFDFAGQSAKFDVIVPGSCSMPGFGEGPTRERRWRSGRSRFRFSFVCWSPALSAKDFASIIRILSLACLRVSGPSGNTTTPLLNLGSNRWSLLELYF